MTKPTYLVDGIALDDPHRRWRLERSTSRRSLPAVRVTNASTPARHGDLFVPGDTYDAPVVGLTIVVSDRDEDGVARGPGQAERNLDLLTAALFGTSRLRELEHRAGDVVRRARARVTSSAQPEALDAGLTRYQLAVVLTVPAVFWTDERGPATFLSSGASTDQTFTLAELAGGTAPVADAVLRFRGPFTGTVRAWDAGADETPTGISWQGTLASNAFLYVDADRLVAHTSTSNDAWAYDALADASSGLDYPAAGPLQLTPTATASGTAYRVRATRPETSAALGALALRAERKYL
jgi:hypothetical protein